MDSGSNRPMAGVDGDDSAWEATVGDAVAGGVDFLAVSDTSAEQADVVRIAEHAAKSNGLRKRRLGIPMRRTVTALGSDCKQMT
jgi:hypothetical protein